MPTVPNDLKMTITTDNGATTTQMSDNCISLEKHYKKSNCNNRCRYWIAKHSATMISTLLVITVLLTLLLTYCMFNHHKQVASDTSKHNHIQSTTEPQMCLTSECLKVASTILDRIDTSINPCDDFYSYACGRFMATSAVPDDYLTRNLLQEMQESMFVEMKNYLEHPEKKSDEHHIKQIKRLYSSCVNESDDEVLLGSSTEVLFDLVYNATGHEWPLLSTNELTMYEEKPLELQLAVLFQHQVQPFFQMYIAPHRNSSTYALHIFPGSTVMEQLNLGLSKHLDNLSDAQIDVYLNFQKEILRNFLLVKGEDASKEQMKQIEADLHAMLQLELDLANISKEMSPDTGLNCSFQADNETDIFHGDLCDERIINPNLFLNVSVEEMDHELEGLNWSRFFTAAFADANVTLKYALIHSKEYFRSLIATVRAANQRTLVNYLGWSIVSKYMPYLGHPFKHISSDLQQKILVPDIDMSDVSAGFKYYHSRWKQCVYIACDGLKIPAISLYLQEHKFQNLTDIASQMKELIEEMKRNFLFIIDSQAWIGSDNVKKVLQERVDQIRSNIGVPPYIQNRSLLWSMYNDLDVDPERELIMNVFKINKHEGMLEVAKLNSEVRFGSEWLFQPLDANAFYDFTSNDIIMPIGIMRRPLVYEHVPKYLEIANLGIVIGHEIAHSIDINSRKQITEQADVLIEANFNQLYKQKAQCFSEKYSAYWVKEADQFVNGNQTLEENICDFASFQQAYSIYLALNSTDKVPLPGLAHYTIDQVFFIHYAQLWCEVATRDGHYKSLQDNHSPGKFRANGVLMNSHSFARVFNCSADSKMNVPDKCDLWSAGH